MKERKKKINPWSVDPPYAQIGEKLVKSKAFEGLKASQKWLYVEFRLRYKGDNPNGIIFTKNEAIKVMGFRQFREGVRLLIKHGLLELVKRGGFYKQPHIYGLSNRWRKFGTKGFIKANMDKIFPQISKEK